MPSPIHLASQLCFFLLFRSTLSASLISAATNDVLVLNVTDGPESQCISPARYPEWNGRILHKDCEVAFEQLREQVAPVADDLFAFYSAEGGFEPPKGPTSLDWPLPTNLIYRTCMIQVRMLHDFRNIEIPTAEGRWIIPADFQPAQLTTWGAIIREAKGVLRCSRYSWPGWGSEGIKPASKKFREFGEIGIFFWGVTSEIAKTYGPSRPPGQLTREGNRTDAVETA